MIGAATEVRKKLKELAGTRGSEGRFLTVTLSTSRLDDWRRTVPSFLNSEFNRIAKELGLDKEARRQLQKDLDFVKDIVSYDITPKTQGLAVFVDGAGDINERIELPFRLINRVVVEPYPHVRPVVHALALLEPFAIAQVSRDESRLYLVDEWGVTHEDEVVGPHLRSTDRETGEISIREYYAAARQDTLVELHYKEVAAALAKLLEQSGASRVVLCAQHDIASAFRRNLPEALGARISAEIPFDAAASVGQMVASARAALDRARGQEVAMLVNQIREALGPGGRGVCGFDDIHGALGRHQVQTLVVDRAYRPPGWRCLDCAWAGLAQTECCPVCGGEVVPLSDAVGELVRLALLQNSEIAVGENIPVLAELGGVAGVLRYG
ncbi:MAG: hypothetical protein N3B14_03235 [Thermoleophilia bacterium]|nr:hypothetical protein [Thermoleophilia bacterium]